MFPVKTIVVNMNKQQRTNVPSQDNCSKHEETTKDHMLFYAINLFLSVIIICLNTFFM